MVLDSADLSTPGRRVSSASGNPIRLKVFAQSGSTVKASGITYPYDSWVGPSSTTDTDWLPSINAQMPAPLPVPAGRAVSISSFNVLSASSKSGPSWSTRAPRVVRQINNLGSSIVTTQELSNSSTGVASGKSQFADLASRLAPNGWKLADDRNFDRTLGLSRWRATQAARIFFKDSVWTQTDRGALRTHVPIQGATEGTNVDRWVSWTRLRANADPNTQVCVLDAHLLTNLGSYDQASADHRNAEVSQIVSELNSSDSRLSRVGTRVGQACSGVPTILGGDLNAAYGHAPYGNAPQESLIDAGFVDTKNAQHRYNTRWSGPGTVGSWHPKYGTQIDYLMVKGAGGASSFKVNMVDPGEDGSDHFPITAVVNLPPVR
jgi:endonuclease/exonuclease/phosphatase family metal-dependent hydrolase